MFHLLLAIIYLSFISLGLPDGLLGAAWPVMYRELAVPVSYAGAVSMTISCGTIVSSLLSDRIIRKLGVGKLTAVSVAMTALALVGFSHSPSFWLLLLWAVPYGLGAGSVDAALNHYVALHYTSRHMSWLHCMWGIGASVGPYIMGNALSNGLGWTAGYRQVGYAQMVLTAVLLFSLPLWEGKQSRHKTKGEEAPTLRLGQIFLIPGAKAVMAAFFCYCALEQTVGLWASSYLRLRWGTDPEAAAGYAGLFFAGITMGRAVGGFLTLRFQDRQMICMGCTMIGGGVLLLLLPLREGTALLGLLLVGLGCAPVYPCMIHSTPEHFGEEHAQAIIGVQMASAYAGVTLMPPLFGLLTRYIQIESFPLYLLLLLLTMVLSYQRVLKRARPGI